MEKTLTAMPTIPTTSEHNAIFSMTFHSSPYENLPSYVNLSSVMNTNSSFITPSAVCTTISPYANVPPVISSSCSTTYSVSNTYYCSNSLVPTPLTFAFPSSEQIACDIITFLVQSSPQSSSNTLPLIVLENMLHKYYKVSLVYHIESLLRVTPNRTYITFETIVRSCISFLKIN